MQWQLTVLNSAAYRVQHMLGSSVQTFWYRRRLIATQVLLKS